MARAGREQQERERRLNAERWAAWLNPALKQAGIGAPGLESASDGQITRQTAYKWINGEHAATAELAIIAARILGADAIDALRAAGHDAIADYAAEMRRDPIGAVIRRELDAIEEDPWLHWLADEHQRGTVTDGEYKRMREDFLRRKRESIQLMRLDYEQALRRNTQNPDRPESDDDGHRAAL